MKNRWIIVAIIVSSLLSAGIAWAATPGALCTTIPGFFASCVPVSIANPLPVVSN